eukprot:jgi/Phyca11/506499/fgenesh2_kg.PHYCAscaffold_20_\
MAADVYGGFQTSMATGVEFYPMQLVPYPPQPPFQPYTNFGGPGNYQQLQQHQAFVGNGPAWMDTAPYYQGGAPQYPFSCAPVGANSPDVTHANDSMKQSEQMDIEDGTSSCSSQASSSIHVSTSEPLKLVTLVAALQDCPGVVSFAKDPAAGSDFTSYSVDFTNEAQASDALNKLDGSICGGQKLRVARSTRSRGATGGGKTRTGSGRRKRQRVDPRSRK